MRLCQMMAISLLGIHSTATAAVVFDFRAPNLASQGSVENQAINAVRGSNTLTGTPTGHLVGGTPAQNANALAFRTIWGLGVQNRNDPLGDRSAFFNTFHVDGKDPEFLRLEFSEPIKITTVVFTYAGLGSTDRFGLAVDGVPINVPALFGTDVIKDLRPAGFAPGIVRFPDTLPLGRTFDFIAANLNDEWNVEKMEVVPEPSSLIVLSTIGLGAVAWLRRRRAQSAASGDRPCDA